MYNPKIKTSFLAYVFGTLGLKKLVLIFDCTILYPWKAVYNYTIQEITIPVSLRNRLISSGLEPVLSHTEKLRITSYYIQFSTNIKMFNREIKTVF